MAQSSFSFHVADFVVCGVTTVVTLGIGLYHALAKGGQNSTAKYLVGNRNMGVVPVSFSFTVTFMSSIFLLGTPAEMYVYGSPSLVGYWISLGLAYIISCLTIVPVIYPLKLTSIYEYLFQRYDSRATQMVGSILGILQNCVYMGIVLFAPSVALKSVAGVPEWVSILIVALIAVIYTAIGGFKAVIWTDVFQMVIIVGGLVAILIKTLVDIESASDVWSFNVDGKRLRTFEFSPDPTIRTGFWAMLFGKTSVFMGMAVSQQSVQRLVSMPTASAAKKIMLASFPGFITLSLLAGTQGLAAYAYYTNKRCDPFEEGVISNSNEILPYFMMELFNALPGIPGVFLAALLSAALSTLSSGLNSMSAVALNDFIKPVWPKMTDIRATLVAKFLVLAFGAITVGVSYLVSGIGGPVTQIAGALLGSISGPSCGMFYLGALFPWANAKGAMVGVLCGLALAFWIAVGATTIPKVPWLPPAPSDMCNVTSSLANMTSSMTNTGYPPEDFIVWTDTPYDGTGLTKFYGMSYNLYPLIGLLTALIVGLLVSFITGANKISDIDPKYIIPGLRKLYNKKGQNTTEENREKSIFEKDTNQIFYTNQVFEGVTNVGFTPGPDDTDTSANGKL